MSGYDDSIPERIKTATNNAHRREQRYRKRLEGRLLADLPLRCVTCGETNPVCFERHHIAGRSYHDATVILCKNCHAKASELQRDHPCPDPEDRSGRFRMMLYGFSDLARMMADQLGKDCDGSDI